MSARVTLPAEQAARRSLPSLSLGSLGYFRKTDQRNEPLYPAGRTRHNLSQQTRNEEPETNAKRSKANEQKLQ